MLKTTVNRSEWNFDYGVRLAEYNLVIDAWDEWPPMEEIKKPRKYLREIDSLATMWTDNPAQDTMPVLIDSMRNQMNLLERKYGQSRVEIEKDISRARQNRQVPEHETYAREQRESML